MSIPDDEHRLITLAVIGFMLAALVWANPDGGSAASFYIALGLFWVLIFVGASGNQGISKDWKRNAVYGAFLGGLFILLHSWSPSIFRIGFYNAIADVRFLIVGLVAPIIEELAFRQGIFKTLLRDKKRVGLVPAIILTSIIFTAFHWYAYGFGQYSAAFVGAFVFSVLACWITERTHDVSAAIILHIITNLMLIWGTFAVFGI